jgi:NADH dehydrogenase
MENKQKIIVIGGGFAGVQFVKNIDENLFDVLLIDKINHHQFQPLFYQLATSQLEPSSISFPLRNIFKNKNNIHQENRKMTTVKGISAILNISTSS